MILRLFRRRAADGTIAALYGVIVAQARSPAFYAAYGVPDTVQGRFDLVVLHMVLLLRRLGRDSAAARSLGQRLFDAFCRDLDGNLREMAIGDLAVPRHMRHFAEAFYGRQAAYLAALESADGRAFENALARNIFALSEPDDRAVQLARYACAAVRELDARREEDLAAARLGFPDPEAFINQAHG